MASYEPTRTQWYGRRAVNPDTTGFVGGEWWYRTDINCWKWYNGVRVCDLPITDETITQEFYIDNAGTCVHGNLASVTELGAIIFVVHVDVTKVDPPQCDVYTPQWWLADSTTVGVTLGLGTQSATGTTITVDALFLGCRPPAI